MENRFGHLRRVSGRTWVGGGRRVYHPDKERARREPPERKDNDRRGISCPDLYGGQNKAVTRATDESPVSTSIGLSLCSPDQFQYNASKVAGLYISRTDPEPDQCQ